MKNNISRFIVVLLTLALFTGMTISMVVAQELPPAPPGDAHSGGSSGGGGGGSYNPPAFQQYSDPLKSSNGTVIGRFDGKNYNSVLVFAEKNGTAGNMTYDLTINGELGAKPSDSCWLDVNFIDPSNAVAFPGWENCLMIGAINISKSPGDWGYKSGPVYTLKIKGLAQNVNGNDPYYIVRSDGSNYQLQKVSFEVKDGQATIEFNPQGDTGIFSIIRAPMATTPAPSATPTATPLPSPTPAPLPDNGGMWTYPIFIALFAVGAIAGAVVVFLFMRGRLG